MPKIWRKMRKFLQNIPQNQTTASAVNSNKVASLHGLVSRMVSPLGLRAHGMYSYFCEVSECTFGFYKAYKLARWDHLLFNIVETDSGVPSVRNHEREQSCNQTMRICQKWKYSPGYVVKLYSAKQFRAEVNESETRRFPFELFYPLCSVWYNCTTTQGECLYDYNRCAIYNILNLLKHFTIWS